MAVRGWVQSCAWEPDGSALTAPVAVGGTVLTVENVGDFDDGGGEVEVNGERITYSADAVDETAGTITLDAGLSAAAAADDWVSVVAGGQPVIDPILTVSMGDGEPAKVVVPFEQRDKWPEGEYDPPVEVLLSDDLTRLEATPGRMPTEINIETVNAGTVNVEGAVTAATVTAWGWMPVRLDSETGEISWWSDSQFTTKVATISTASAIALQFAWGTDFQDTFTLTHPSGSGASFQVNGVALFEKDLTTYGELHGNTVHVDSVPTSSNAANTYMGPSGKLYQSSSSKRYKKQVRDADPDLDLDAYMALGRVSWVSRNPEDGSDRFVGRLAEDVAAAGLEFLVVRDAEGKPDAVAYPTEVIYLQAALARAFARIDALTERVAALEAAPSSRSTRASKEN